MSQSSFSHVRRQVRRLVTRLDPRRAGGRRVDGIPGPVHVRDTMYDPSEEKGIEYYLRAGRSAVAVLRQTLEAAQRSPGSIDRVIDYGCGYGRVLRHLPSFLPSADFVACDLDAEAVAFCRRAFAATGVVAPTEPADLELPTADLVWGGSVFTHLPAEPAQILFDRLGHSLRPGGVLVFSFHGHFAFAHLDTLFGGAYADQAEAIPAEVAQHGLAYRSYPESYLTLGEGSYGTAWHAAETFRGWADESAVSLRELHHLPQGWDSFHDVIAFQRTP